MTDRDIAVGERLSGALQENILTLLCFDSTTAPIIANVIEPGLFDSDIYKEISKKAIEYLRQFGEAPKEHLPDLFETILTDSKNQRKADLYQQTLVNLYDFRDSVNSKFVLTQLNRFIREQRWKETLVEAVQLARDGQLDELEKKVQGTLVSQIDVFQPGIAWGKDLNRTLGFFDQLDNAFPTGIAPLDRMGIGPAPGQLLVILAPPNRGKSFFLIHLGKHSAMQRLKVLHISLEMSEEITSQRYVQAFFALTKRQPEAKYMTFVEDEMGRFMDLSLVQIERPTLVDANAEVLVSEKIKKIQSRIQLYIKRFPTGALNIGGLEAYLDSLHRLYHFTPDLVLLDYADLMQLNSAQLRTDTGFVYKELRRVAVERNIAMVTASQSNRLGEDSRVLTLKHLAEDYSKAATADDILAYCQTRAEVQLGLARLFIAKARNEEKEKQILISQCYRMGQFAMNAVEMTGDRYWDRVHTLTGGQQGEEGEEEPQQRQPRRRLPVKST